MRAPRSTLLLAPALLIACGGDDDKNPVDGNGGETPGEIEVPSAYVFDSRFSEGESSVAYSGQTVRNLLLQDLKILIDSAGKDGARPISVQEMLDLYDYDDALDLQSRTTTGDRPAVEKPVLSHLHGEEPVGQDLG